MLQVTLVVPMLSNRGGGLAEAVRLQAEALARTQDIAVEIVTTRDGPRDLNDLLLDHVRVRAFAYFGPSGFRFSPALLWYLLWSRPDLVHLHGLWNFQGLAVLVWSLLHRGRYVVSAHGMLEPWILARSKLAKMLVSILWQSWLLRRAAWCCALTTAEAAQLQDRCRAPVAVIPNFVVPLEQTNIAPVLWQEQFRDRTVFLMLCRIHDKKGWRELCSAWAMLCADPATAQKIALVFCGWIDDTADFAATVAGLGAKYGNVIYAGPQYGAAKAASLSHASYFVLPSKSEGLPIGVLEAWAAGVPTLISAECRLPQGFEGGAAIDCGTSPQTILAALRQALGLTAADQQRMSRAAQHLAKTDFSENRVVSGLLTLYLRVRGAA